MARIQRAYVTGISGLTVLETLVSQSVDQPVIMLTGHGTVDMCRRAFKLSAAEFLEKPVNDEHRLEALQNAVRQHVKSRERNKMGRQAQERFAQLSEREREELGLIDSRAVQQRNWPDASGIVANFGDASSEFVCQAGGRVAGAVDSAVCGVGGAGFLM